LKYLRTLYETSENNSFESGIKMAVIKSHADETMTVTCAKYDRHLQLS